MINLSSEKEVLGVNDNKSNDQLPKGVFLSCEKNTVFSWCLPED